MTTRFAARSYVPGVTVQMWWVTWEQVMDPALSKHRVELEALGDTFTGPADVLPLDELQPVIIALNAMEIINGLEQGNAVILDPEFDIDDSPATDAEVGVWTLNVPDRLYEEAHALGRVSKLVSMGDIAALVLCEVPNDHVQLGTHSDGSPCYDDDRICY